MAIGFDVGTYNLVSAFRNDDGDVDCMRHVNAFIEIPIEEKFVFKMMEKAGVPLIKRDKMAFAVGEQAVDIAYSFKNLELRRPMKDGCVNPKEKDGYSILATTIHSLIGNIKKDGETLCYSVPANAINDETDADYHQEVLKQIFTKYSVNGKKVNPIPVNEALALIYAELQHKFLTGIACSFGSGMVNVCYANRSVPIFQFSIVNSGDWVDKQAAKAAATTPTIINKEKTKIGLLDPPKNEVERAIQMQYRLMIKNTVRKIKEGLEASGDALNTDDPVDLVVAGGTASPKGFVEILKEQIQEIGLPIKIGEIIKPKDHLYAVARGCLEAAEANED